MTDPALIAAHTAPVHAPSHRLEVQWDGLAWTDESAAVLSMKGVESVDDVLLQANASEVDVELDNSDRRYSADNASSALHPYLTHAGQRARLSLGWDGVLAQIGTYWIDDLNPSETTKTASLRLLDRGSWLADRTTSYGPQGAVRVDNVIRQMLTAAGLVEGTDFVLDVADQSCRFAYAVNKPLLAELRSLAFAEGGRILVDPYGVVQFTSATNHRLALARPVTTFTRSQVAYDAPRVRRRDRSVNEVHLSYEDRDQAIADEIVYDQKAALAVPAAVTYTYKQITGQTVVNGQNVFTYADVQAWSPGVLSIRVKGMDMTRWERSLPLLFTTINTATANTAANGSGTNLPITWSGAPAMSGFSNAMGASWTPSGSVGFVTFYNQSGAPAYVTALKVNGKPARTVSPFSVMADAVEAQGDGIVLAELSNAYLPDTDAAMQRAQDYLYQRSGLRARIDPRMDGCPYLHPLDAFAFVDDSQAPATTEYLQVLSNAWDYSPSGGYSCQLKTGPALPPTQSLLANATAAPTDGALATATDSGPWTWDGGHPLAWTWSEWG